jgi:hypothetical protein
MSVRLLGVHRRDDGKLINPLERRCDICLTRLLGGKARLDLIASEDTVR